MLINASTMKHGGDSQKIISYHHVISPSNIILAGGFKPREQYESQLGRLFPIYGKIEVPNHQPDGILVYLAHMIHESMVLIYLPAYLGTITIRVLQLPSGYLT